MFCVPPSEAVAGGQLDVVVPVSTAGVVVVGGFGTVVSPFAIRAASFVALSNELTFENCSVRVTALEGKLIWKTACCAVHVVPVFTYVHVELLVVVVCTLPVRNACESSAEKLSAALAVCACAWIFGTTSEVSSDGAGLLPSRLSGLNAAMVDDGKIKGIGWPFWSNTVMFPLANRIIPMELASLDIGLAVAPVGKTFITISPFASYPSSMWYVRGVDASV
jgi:hypothetical protein